MTVVWNAEYRGGLYCLFFGPNTEVQNQSYLQVKCLKNEGFLQIQYTHFLHAALIISNFTIYRIGI